MTWPDETWFGWFGRDMARLTLARKGWADPGATRLDKSYPGMV